MKAFILVCLAAAAIAEPQGFYPYGTYGTYGYNYNPLYNPLMPVQYIKPAEVKVEGETKPVEQEVKVETYMQEPEKVEAPTAVFYNHPMYRLPYVMPATYEAKSAGGVEHKVVLKREAEAEPEPFWNPYSQLSHYPSSYLYHPYVPHTKTYANDFVRPEMYASKGQYVAKSAGVVHIAKREAEPIHHYRYLQPSMYHSGVVSPYHQTPYHQTPYHYSPLVHPYTRPITYSNDAVKSVDYAAKGQYVAQTAGSLHVAKREAEADPALIYPNTYATGYPFYRNTMYGSSPFYGSHINTPFRYPYY